MHACPVYIPIEGGKPQLLLCPSVSVSLLLPSSLSFFSLPLPLSLIFSCLSSPFLTLCCSLSLSLCVCVSFGLDCNVESHIPKQRQAGSRVGGNSDFSSPLLCLSNLLAGGDRSLPCTTVSRENRTHTHTLLLFPSIARAPKPSQQRSPWKRRHEREGERASEHTCGMDGRRQGVHCGTLPVRQSFSLPPLVLR